jgi:hypothetical protein
MDRWLNERKVGKAVRCRDGVQTGSALRQNPGQWIKKVRQTGRAARCSISSGPEGKDECSVTSTSLYAFKVRCLTKQEEKFGFQISLKVMEKEKLMSKFSFFKGKTPIMTSSLHCTGTILNEWSLSSTPLDTFVTCCVETTASVQFKLITVCTAVSQVERKEGKKVSAIRNSLYYSSFCISRCQVVWEPRHLDYMTHVCLTCNQPDRSSSFRQEAGSFFRSQ